MVASVQRLGGEGILKCVLFISEVKTEKRGREKERKGGRKRGYEPMKV